MHKRAAVTPKANLSQYIVSKVFMTFSNDLYFESRFKADCLKSVFNFSYARAASTANSTFKPPASKGYYKILVCYLKTEIYQEAERGRFSIMCLEALIFK